MKFSPERNSLVAVKCRNHQEELTPGGDRSDVVSVKLEEKMGHLEFLLLARELSSKIPYEERSGPDHW